MPTYHTPGVYIEEVPSGARPIELVGTSTAAFVGVAPKGDAALNEARPCANWTEFLRTFVADTPLTGEPNLLANAVYGFFQNGGSYCYVVNVGEGNPVAGKGRGRVGISLLEERDDVAIVAAPGYTDAASYSAVLDHCEAMKNRVAVLDAPKGLDSIQGLTQVGGAKEPRDSSGSKAEDGSASGAQARAARPRNSAFGSLYFPWITARDALDSSLRVSVPPSGHMAGIFARTDATRGVHKAPANEAVRGAVDLGYNLTRDEQGLLNQRGVNCLRFFQNEGIRVWGARTLDDAASPWRYLPVRRLFCQIEESIARGTRWVVFEPNDEPLWKSIVRDVTGLLTRVWRSGALMGRSPEEAFFVKCDHETNSRENVDAGVVSVVIGMAPVKPAEFIVFRIGQSVEGVSGELG
jgi:hypothetical protein